MLLSASEEPINGYTLRAILQSTGSRVAIETACNCRIDAAKALKAVMEKPLTVVPNALTLAPSETSNFSAWGGEGPFTYASSNAAVAAIDESGLLTAKTLGLTKVTVTDAAGETATSLDINVAEAAPASQCPLEDPNLCLLFCAIEPTFPWCTK